MLVSKSLTAALAGVLAARGGGIAPQALITDYVPEVARSAHEGATVQHLLEMRMGVDFDEDCSGTSGVMHDYREATAWNAAPEGPAPDDLRDVVSRVKRAVELGA